MRSLFVYACVAALALALAGGAVAGSSYTLHPAGRLRYEVLLVLEGAARDP